MTRSSTRRGIALLSALSLLALLGLLLAGALALTTIGQRAARASVSDGPLLGAADYAAGEILADPTRFALADLALGAPTRFDVPVPGVANIGSSVVATRLPNGVYWLVATATMAGADSARRRVNVVARTDWIGPPPAAPFVSRGSTSVGSDVVVMADSESEADCAVDSISVAAIQTDDSAAVFDSSSQWNALAAASGVRVVHGDTTISSGAFEGILMVEGDLIVGGSFDMKGLIVARGRIRSSLGLRLTGALVSQASGGGSTIDLGGATVRFAPCYLSRLLRRVSPVRASRGRGWVELF
jgi:hypothetical protein